MSGDNIDREAQRRVTEACDLIRSAYRLSYLDPKETLRAVVLAIGHGAEQAAEDVADDAARALSSVSHG